MPEITAWLLVPSNGEPNMLKRSRHVTRSTTHETHTNQKKPRDDRRTHLGGRETKQYRRGVPPREHRADAVLPLETEVQGSGHSGTEGTEARPKDERLRERKHGSRQRETCGSSLRSIDRTSVAEKKRELGLAGSLVGRHLSHDIRAELLKAIDYAISAGESMATICTVLEINPRAIYRWKSGETKMQRHGGGGGLNKITPLEEKRVVTLARKFPQFRCRRIAYELERKSLVFIGKTKVAEIMKKHGLNHAFERGVKKPLDVPAEMLLHEPWRKNLLWGMDWTYLRIAGRFWFLLIMLDWYSRKIVAWGLFPEITRFEVVALVTDAVALEGIDALPEGAMKPRVVADHGSANIAAYTKKNIEIQGLDLWLSGIGRPTGNARTERVMGTLKREEIKLQDEYGSEDEARSRIRSAIWDYCFRRPNAGNGGFAPNSVHILGRSVLTKRRKEARQHTENRRRKHWDQNQPC